MIGTQLELIDADVTRRDAKQQTVVRRIELRIELSVGSCCRHAFRNV